MITTSQYPMRTAHMALEELQRTVSPCCPCALSTLLVCEPLILRGHILCSLPVSRLLEPCIMITRAHGRGARFHGQAQTISFPSDPAAPAITNSDQLLVSAAVEELTCPCIPCTSICRPLTLYVPVPSSLPSSRRRRRPPRSAAWTARPSPCWSTSPPPTMTWPRWTSSARSIRR